MPSRECVRGDHRPHNPHLEASALLLRLSSFTLLQVLPYVTPGATKFLNASLVVDVAGILNYVASPQSAEKAGLIRIPLGWSGWGYWG